MRWVQHEVFNGMATGVWMTDEASVQKILDLSRLQDQMFASMVADQIIDTFNEIGLPYILRFYNSIYNSISSNSYPWNGNAGTKKWIGFEAELTKQQHYPSILGKDEVASEQEEKDDRMLLERIRSEVALPPYDLFDDYSEMVTQFGYVVLWSTIWPLAPSKSLIGLSEHLWEITYFCHVYSDGPGQ